jgi:hypothetical protein
MSTCPFALKTGKNKGEKCGSKVYQNSEFCKRHLPKSETPETNDTKQEKTPIKSKEKKVKEEKPEKEKKETKEKKTKPVIKETPSINHKIYETFKLSAKRNQYGNYILENDLIVEPGPDRIILGRQFEDKIIDISIEDIDFCKLHGLLYKEPINMYFRNNENEKAEMILQKELLKELEKKDENMNETDENEIDEDEIEEEDNDEDENEL